MVKPHATKGDFETAFKGFYYPISRAGILTSGRDKGGIDREVGYVLSLLPERRYRNADDLKEAVRDVYRAQGVPDRERDHVHALPPRHHSAVTVRPRRVGRRGVGHHLAVPTAQHGAPVARAGGAKGSAGRARLVGSGEGREREAEPAPARPGPIDVSHEPTHVVEEDLVLTRSLR